MDSIKSTEGEDKGEDEEDEDEAIVTDATSGNDEEVTDLTAIKDDINTLTDNNLLNQQSINKFQACLKKISSTPIAMFCSIPSSDDDKIHKKRESTV